MGLALHSAEKFSSSAHTAPSHPKALQTPTPVPAEHHLPQTCACGGGCPRCALQKKVKVGPAGDAYEHEADSVADRLVSGESVSLGGRVGAGESAGIEGLSSGHTLPASVQRDFGPRLGHDLSGVRVHHDDAADRAATSVGARAFTLGRDLVFARGEFSPNTGEGRRLLAHELVHWVQQGGRADRIQRNLKVDKNQSDDKTTAISQMTPLLQKICPDFDVHATNGHVTAKAGTDCATGKFGGVATGSKKLGCCCLCTLARAPDPSPPATTWKIIVTTKDSPSTDDRTRTVRMTPTSGGSVPDLRYWTGGKETIQRFSREEVLGHELCGHAALDQINADTPDDDADTARTFSDIHDPTVKIENVLASELGKRTTKRGLAASGRHRGESLRVFVVKPFTADDATISSAAQKIIDGAAKYADDNADTLIDSIGFRDASDTKESVSKQRADDVRTKLESKLTKKDDVGFHLSPGAAETKIPRLQPTVDGGVGSVASVEIRLASQPAGLVNLPAGVTLPATPTHVDPEHPAVVKLGKTGKTGNACHDLLITTAWT